MSPGGREEGWFLEGPGVMSQEERNGERMKICIPQLSVPIAPTSAANTSASSGSYYGWHTVGMALSPVLPGSPLSVMPSTSSAATTTATNTGNKKPTHPFALAKQNSALPRGSEPSAGCGGWVSCCRQPAHSGPLEKSGRQSLPPCESTEICQIAPAELVLLRYLSLQGPLVYQL